ncbi:MAG: autotransporter domain-containing protein [Rhodospirillaceae bacterium]|nr:autotransporter domain-containing protein [Rhodospirillaceae bacterium]
MNSSRQGEPAGALGRSSMLAVRMLLLAVVAVVWLAPQDASAQPPTVIRSLEDLTLTVGTEPHVVDLRGVYFGAPEECDAESSEESVATAEVVDGYDLVVTPVGVGHATITASASNEFGSVEHDFEVEVVHVPPVAVGAFPDQELRVGDVLPLELSGAFRGEALEYSAVSSDEESATVSVSGSTASITALKAGMATVTVTATNTGGTAEQKVVLRILDVPPAVAMELPDITITVGHDPASINLAEAFSGSALVFAGSSSAEDIASVSVDGYMATITAIAAGTAMVTVSASNSEGTAEQTFTVTVMDDRPMAVGMLPDLTITVGDDPVAVDVSQAFTGTTLSFSAMSSSEANASVSASGATVTVTAVAAGMATVTVTAMNAQGSADQSFMVTVEDVPPATAAPLPDVSLVAGGEPAMVDASAAFTGTALVFSASASGDAVSVSVAGGHVSVAPRIEGEATVTVTAMNTAGQASQSFTATVSTDAAESDALENTVAAIARSTLASVNSAIGSRFRAERMGAPASSASGFAPGYAGTFASASAGPFGAWPQSGMTFGEAFPAGPRGSVGYQAGPYPYGSSSFGYGPATRSGGLQQLSGMNFAIPLNAASSGGAAWTPAAEWTFWGSADRQGFDGDGFDGDLISVYLGADANFGDKWLAGVALSHSSGDADYKFSSAYATGTGELDTSMVSVLPYVRWSIDDKSEVWAIAGAGWGDVDLDRSATSQEGDADLSMWMLSAGGRRVLASGDEWNFALTGDAGILEMQTDGGVGIIDDMNVDVGRVKLAFEGERVISMEDGNRLAVFGQVGGRHDSGDGETGSGVELTGGVRFDTAGRVRVEAKARLLSLHSAGGYDENGVSVSAIVRPRADGTGVSLALSSYLGTGMSANNASLEQGYGYPGRRVEDLGLETDAWGMDARIGYALKVRRLSGLLTPFASFDMAGNDGHGMRMGLRYDLAGQGSTMLNLEFTGGQEYDRWRREAHNMVQLRAELRF